MTKAAIMSHWPGEGETLCPTGAWTPTSVSGNGNPPITYTYTGKEGGFLGHPCPQPLNPPPNTYKGAEKEEGKSLTHRQRRFQYNLYYLIYIFLSHCICSLLSRI